MGVIIVLITIVAIFLPVILVFLVARSISKNDDEFPGSNINVDNFNQWYNLDIFRKIVYKLAEKDEEIKNYLLACKNKHDSNTAHIYGSNVDRKADSQDISSDI